jgi:hypothetical protein
MVFVEVFIALQGLARHPRRGLARAPICPMKPAFSVELSPILPIYPQ